MVKCTQYVVIEECVFNKNRSFAYTIRLSKKWFGIIIIAVNNNTLLDVAHFV